MITRLDNHEGDLMASELLRDPLDRCQPLLDARTLLPLPGNRLVSKRHTFGLERLQGAQNDQVLLTKSQQIAGALVQKATQILEVGRERPAPQ
jgi:hypothetical protein